MIELGNAIEEIEEDVADPRYEATWYHLFEGGCIVYEFDARGFGSETLETDVDQALGLYPLDALRAAARNAGFDI